MGRKKNKIAVEDNNQPIDIVVEDNNQPVDMDITSSDNGDNSVDNEQSIEALMEDEIKKANEQSISESSFEVEQPEQLEQVEQVEQVESEQSTKKKPRKPRVKKQSEIPAALNDADDDFIQLENELRNANIAKPIEPEKKRKKEKDFSNFLSGYLVLYLCDSIAPFLFSFIAKKFLKIDLSASKLKLTNTQWKRIEPIADEVVKTLSVKMSPMQAFIFMMGLSYFENATQLILEKKK